MKINKRNITHILILLCVLWTTAGCLSVAADDLYSLPEISAEYVKLQAQINMLLSRGAVQAAPVRGPNRQAVQLVDIDNNGTHEVIAFFSFPGESKLMIYIFTHDDDNDYVAAEIIESVGTQIDSVRYVDMDNDGNMELILGWQMGSSLRYMSIYSIINYNSKLLVSSEEYSEIIAFNSKGTGGDDVLLFRLATQDTGNALAKLFSLMPDGEIVTEEARLSAGVESITHMIIGWLEDGVPAMFVESDVRFEEGILITDILARQDGNFTNISLMPATGISSETLRSRMNCTDINGDGIIEVPQLRRLATQSDTEYSAVDWYNYKSTGERTLELSTYHNIFDEWFLILPDDWGDKVSVRRDDTTPGERTIIFSYYEQQNPEAHKDFLAICRMSGEDAAQRAQEANRIILNTEGAVTYAFSLLAAENSYGLTFDEEIIKDNFRLIRSDR